MHFDHFTVRLLTKEDLNSYFTLIDSNRSRLEDFFAGTVAITRTLADTSIHLDDVIDKAGKKNYFPFVVIDDQTRTIIASIQVKSLDWNVPKAELGYYVDQHYEGRGIIQKSLTHIIQFCFMELNLKKLYIRTHESNIASRKVAENNGFVLEGIIRCDYRTTRGELVDLMYYGLLKEEYQIISDSAQRDFKLNKEIQ